MHKVAVIQMISGADWRKNLEDAAGLIRQAAEQGAELVLLPENFAVFNTSQLLERGAAERSADGPIRQFLAAQAKQLGIWLVAGSVPVLNDGGNRVRAACFVFDDEGGEQTRYDKLHLFDVDVADSQAAYRESDQIEAGERIRLVDTPVGRLGLSICYDLRFPLLYQKMVELGAELISVPAAFTKVTGEAHWELLLRARAIETQCFVLAANQGGRHNERRETWGQSMIVDPWGRVLAQQASGAGVVMAGIDSEQLREVRARMPVRQHCRNPDQLL